MGELAKGLLVAVGLVFVIEGLLYSLAPGLMRRIMLTAISLPPEALRKGGVFAVAFGVALVWLVKS
ncbi:MAG: DUF2065 domain-containing protein [Alphaproteobacteria bacterium]